MELPRLLRTEENAEDAAWQKLDGKVSPGEDDSFLQKSFAESLTSPKDQSNVAFLQLLRSVRRVAAPFFCEASSRRKAWCMSTVVIALTLVFARVMVWVSETVKGYNQALEEKNQEAFWHSFNSFLLIIAVLIPILAASEASKRCLSLEWRQHLTNRLLSGYIGNSQAFYRLKLADTGIDNPDQRIAQDVGEFTRYFVDLAVDMVGSFVTTVAMSKVLLDISGRLFLFLVVFSFCVTVLSATVFGKPLVQVQREVLAKEATLRFGLVRVREHAESIAFYQGATAERSRSSRLFTDVISSLYRQLRIQCLFHGFNTAAHIAAPLLTPLILAPQYFNGEIQFGQISQAGMVFGTLLGTMTKLMSQLDLISSLSAQALRVQQLWDQLEEMSAEAAGARESDLEVGRSRRQQAISLFELPECKPGQELASAVCLEVASVSLQPPSSQSSVPLLKDVSVTLHNHESLIISGESGIGKSSLLRAIGGLWAGGSGSIRRCPAGECFFLPQEPYMCLGTLRDNALYPSELQEGSVLPSDSEIRGALGDVNLGYLVDRYGMDSVVDFDGVLSGGEKQRLSFARLLLRRGLRLAVLDEATSALDADNEAHLYQLLSRRVQSFVSVGHRPNLEKFHSHKLTLQRQGSSSTAQLTQLKTA
eukprot:TRINITY_DN21830_c0_g1_i1.p1 TRINITY_DN21830_c0_g1~~TRINITY_DN21830_c0_g1_i1.p1  ORF type:complete len:676 (+),score=130.69 TRINITY_DN21830_c0_g1_i1:87-2030(+)